MGEEFIYDFCPCAMYEPTAIDIDRFVCEYLGKTQDFAWLSKDGRYLGMTVFNDTRRVIVYNPEQNEAEYFSAKAGTVIIDNSLLDTGKEHRYRFTMGHESAHVIFHTEHFMGGFNRSSSSDSEQEPMVQCRADSTAALKNKLPKQWTPKERMEWQANRMASALLMPRAMVRKLYYSLPKTEEGASFAAMAVLAVAEAFNVSCEAAQYRLLDCGLIHNRTDVQALIAFA